MAQIDTASGVVNDIEAIGKAIRAAGHPALYMVDTVASLGCMPFAMDDWGIDVAMSGSQKGLMTPPGLGFVAANDRAFEVHKTRQYAHALLGLDRARGHRALPQICRHRAGASVVRAAPGHRHAVRGRARQRLHPPSPARPRRCAARSRSGPRARCSASTSPRPSERSNTVTTVTMSGDHDPAALHHYCKEKCGVVLGDRDRRSGGQGVPDRPYGPCQRADDPRHARRHRGRPQRARRFPTARAEPRPRSSGSAKV